MHPTVCLCARLIVHYTSDKHGRVAELTGSLTTCAAVVELVDTPDSKSCEGNLVSVQVRPAAPVVKEPGLHAALSLDAQLSTVQLGV